MRGYCAFTLSEATLLDLEKDLSKLSQLEGKPAWTRKDTSAFLEQKGPLGKRWDNELPITSKVDPLKTYILECVTAYTWATKVTTAAMKVLFEMWTALPPPDEGPQAPSPHRLLVHPDSEQTLFEESIIELQRWYLPYAYEHLLQLGYALLDGLASIRHYEGCEEHFDAQAAQLTLQGVKFPTDNRYVCM